MIADELTYKSTKVAEVAKSIREYEMASGVGSWTLREFIAFALITCNKATPSNSLETADRCIERLARELVEQYAISDR